MGDVRWETKGANEAASTALMRSVLRHVDQVS